MAPTNKPMSHSGKSHNNGEDKSHQMSALANDSRFRGDFIPCNYEAVEEINAETGEVPVAKVPFNVEDYDKNNCKDMFKVPQYAREIFQYLKQREDQFPIIDYMKTQKHLSKTKRALLVDWMVGMQTKLELHHETLYLAVKIVDIYLCKVIITKNQLQILGTTALLIASKYEESTFYEIEDFLNSSNGSYTRAEVMAMEMLILRTIGYNLGIPLSYSFLRRYASCAKIPKPTLALARYILEMALMYYSTIRFKDSQMAAAALFMALRMHGNPKAWTPQLEYCSGYALGEFSNIVPVINVRLPRKRKALREIRMKYSRYQLYKVAMTQLKNNDELLENNIDLGNCVIKEVVENGKKHSGAVTKETVSHRATKEEALAKMTPKSRSSKVSLIPLTIALCKLVMPKNSEINRKLFNSEQEQKSLVFSILTILYTIVFK